MDHGCEQSVGQAGWATAAADTRLKNAPVLPRFFFPSTLRVLTLATLRPYTLSRNFLISTWQRAAKGE